MQGKIMTVKRPLSPHLQIYRPMLSMTMSIMHRITGVALASGFILLVWWFSAASISDEYFNYVNGFFSHWFGRVVMLGFTWALIHHMLGGLRHFVWDTGKGFALPKVEWLVRANLIGSIVLTILVWAIGYGMRA
jgi:succinate dehydrogenase / fumarate reductase, cytochrome b subunit